MRITACSVPCTAQERFLSVFADNETEPKKVASILFVWQFLRPIYCSLVRKSWPQEMGSHAYEFHYYSVPIFNASCP